MIPEAVSTLKQLAGLSQAREALHHLDGADTGSNSIGRQQNKFIGKECPNFFLGFPSNRFSIT